MSSRGMFDGIIRSVERAGRAPARASMPRMGQRRPTGRTPLSARRRKAKFYVYLLTCGAILVLLGGLIWATYHPRLAIVSVDVRGEESVLQTEVEATVREVLDEDGFHIFSRRNIFLYPRTDVLEKILASYPRVQHVGVERPTFFSQTLVVTVHERQAWARWCELEECYLMDSTGYVYAPAGEWDNGYQFSGGLSADASPVTQVFLRGNLSGVVSMLAYLDGKKYPARGAEVLGEKDYTIHLQNGLRIHVPFNGEPDTLVRNLETVLTSDVLSGKISSLYYIDLRYGNRVYYGFHAGELDQGVLPTETIQ